MKKLFPVIAAAIFGLLITTSVSNAQSDSGVMDQFRYQFHKMFFLDADGDGVCDNYQSFNKESQKLQKRLKDGSGDGIGNCDGFVDSDGDGICDNPGECDGLKKGSGGNGKGNDGGN